jgi:hypothetical protein
MVGHEWSVIYAAADAAQAARSHASARVTQAECPACSRQASPTKAASMALSLFFSAFPYPAPRTAAS